MNPYLFRETERHLWQQGGRPSSAVQDQIGSQASKGMHVLAKFARIVESCGIWTDGDAFHAIETYPAVCRDAAPVRAHLHRLCPLLRLGEDRTKAQKDEDDALTCAIVAYLFATDPAALEPPPATISPSEGWIWAPRQAHAPITT